jgi:hypothetical protein
MTENDLPYEIEPECTHPEGLSGLLFKDVMVTSPEIFAIYERELARVLDRMKRRDPAAWLMHQYSAKLTAARDDRR